MKIADLPDLYAYDILPTEEDEIEVGATGITWLSKDNIYISVPFQRLVNASIEDIESKLATWKLNHHDNGKVLLLTVVHPKQPQNREIRKLLEDLLPKYVKAQALVSKSPLGKMLGNLFFKLNPQPYPFKFFTDPQKGVEWLKKQCA